MRQKFVKGAVLTVALVGSLFIATQPAEAYSPNPSTYHIIQNAGTCAQIESDNGDFKASDDGHGNCVIKAFLGFGYTPVRSFPKDSGGTNAMVIMLTTSTTVGEVDFQAYGEHLTVRDPIADGDTFYVTFANGEYCNCGSDSGAENLSLTDGDLYALAITDDKAGTDPFVYPNGSGLIFVRA